MLVVVPSRGRPESLRRMLKSFEDMETRCKVLIRIDHDDKTMWNFDDYFPENVQIIMGQQVKSVGAMTEAYSMYPDEDCYALLGDDCVARTMRWDEELRKSAGDWHIAFPDDMLKGETLAAHPAVGAKFIKALGFWALPGLIHLYQDKAIDFLGRLYGNLIYRPDVVVEHLHFSVGKSPFDETYRRTFKGRDHAQHDHDVYTAWSERYKKDPEIERQIAIEGATRIPVAAHDPVRFVFLKAGTEFGPEYVNILRDMVRRNLPAGFDCRFSCITDDTSGLDPDIETLPLPDDLERWWGKIYMFKRNLFQDGTRCVFIDLDTIVLGKLDDIVSYRGQFATLRDFWHPKNLGPAWIMWEAGDYAASIWEEWCAEGKPKTGHGDLWWIGQLDQGRFAKRADILQNLFPGAFQSYKTTCIPRPPKGTRVVCFHGLPRPHQALDVEWVRQAWRVGGMVEADMAMLCNTEVAQVRENIRRSCALDIPWMELSQPRPGDIAVVGGGPSLEGSIDELRYQAHLGMKIIAVNGAHDYLLDHGVTPDWHLLIDARPENIRFVGRRAKAYLLASQCDPEIFDKAGDRATLLHMNTEGVLDYIPENTKPINLISSGSTVALAGMGVAYCMGYRQLYLYGMDSSFEREHHVYAQESNDGDAVVDAVAGERTFKTTPWMVAQVQAFQKLTSELIADDCEIHVRCGGLLGHVAWIMAHQMPVPEDSLPVNTTASERLDNIRRAMESPLPLFKEQTAHGKTALIVGGGPSLERNLAKLRLHRKRGGVIFALNGAHDYLIDRGIRPDFCVIADARQGNVTFLKHPDKAIHYLIAAQCHPDVFAALEGFDVTVWVPYVEGLDIDAIERPVIVITGGATVGLKAMQIAHLWGFMRLRLFGMDGSYIDGRNHAYPQPMNDAETVLDHECMGRTFRVAPWMVQQAQDFEMDVSNLEREGTRVYVHGEGLIAHVFHTMQPQRDIA